jgi:para-nitrobenzyl esterase
LALPELDLDPDRSLDTTIAGNGMTERGVFVATRNGALRGLDLGNVVVFHGIPFASPPVGDLRWMPPQPANDWKDVRDATDIPPRCAQNRYLGVFAKEGGQEDCLYLNVWMPKNADSSLGKLPVMVWIHGGALWVGAGSDYDGRKLAAHGNAIVVTINYRLGILGMFAHPAIALAGHSWGNFGLMDQHAALRWVRDNIEAFGGNPNNVTILGESSGGTSVMAHIVSPQSAGLFHHAITMSGTSTIIKYPNFGGVMPTESALEMGVAFGEAAGCDGTLKSLLNLTIEKILDVQTPYLPRQFFVDGHTLPALYSELIRAGKVNGKTLTVGVMRDEWTWSVGTAENETGVVMTTRDYEKAILDFYGQAHGPKVLAEYPLSEYSSPSEAYAVAVTQSLFAAPGHKTLELMSKWMPVYGYEFLDRTAPSYLEPTTFPLGAGHTFELAYIFPGYHGAEGRPVALNQLQEKLSDRIISLFARTGEATGAREAEWPRYDPAKENYLTFVLPEPRQPLERFSQVHNVAFWDALGLW